MPNERTMWFAEVRGLPPDVRVCTFQIQFVETNIPGMWVCAEQTEYGDNPFFTEWLADNEAEATRLAIDRKLGYAKAAAQDLQKQIAALETRKFSMITLINELEDRQQKAATPKGVKRK